VAVNSGSKIRTVLISILFGLSAYILNAVLKYLISDNHAFWDHLILNVPSEELITRLMTIALFVLFGMIIAHSWIPGLNGRSKAAASEEKFRNVVESSPMGMHFYSLESDGKLIFEGANPSADKLLGLDNSQFIGKTIEEAFPGAEGTEIPKRYSEAAKLGKTWQSEQVNYVDERIEGAFQVVAFQTTKNRMAALFFDITEQKKAEEALMESEEKFRNLSEQSPNMIFINKGGRIVYANTRCEEILDYRKEDFYSSDFNFFDIIAPEYIPVVKEKYEKHLRGEDITPYEYALLTKDGNRIEAIINTKIIHYEGEKSILGIVTDIAERKRAEEAIRESEEKFRKVAEQSPNMIFINKQGRIVYVNNKCETIMGYKREEFYSSNFNFLDLIAPEHIQIIKENFEVHNKGEEVEPHEYVIVTKNGDRIDVIINTRLIKYDGVPSILGIVTDITDRKKAEKVLQKSQRDLVKAQQIAKVGSWEWDVKSEKVYWSDEMYRIYGVENGTEPSNDLVRELIYPEDSGIFEKAMKDLLDNKPPEYIEYRIIKPGGEIAYVQVTAEAQHNDNGDAVRLIGTVQDITERKRSEELREKLIADLQKAANEIKTLSGLIPICASCKKIRDDKGYWEQIETYIMEHSDAEFSHGLCPECSKKLYPDL
jgi:PAS domain S-box-containing protein